MSGSHPAGDSRHSMRHRGQIARSALGITRVRRWRGTWRTVVRKACIQSSHRCISKRSAD